MSVDWSDIYRQTYGDLVRFLTGKVWDPERARDLAQEVFVRALDHEPDRPRAWLFSVAANLARDEARTAVRRRGHLTLLETEAREASVAAPEGPARVEAAEERERVQGALRALSERDREALLLWSAGNSYEEIARVTGLAKGAIGTTLARARKRLLAAYEGWEDDAARHGR